MLIKMRTRLIENGKLSAEAFRLIRFIIIGSFNTAAGYGFYAAYLYIGISYIIAGTLSYVTSIIFNYFVTKRFVFDQPTHKYTFIFYIAYTVFLYCFSIVLLWLLVNVFKLDPYMAGLASIPINAIVSFIILRGFVFRQRNVNVVSYKADLKDVV
jgi:putative flippase GtrA